MRWAGRVARVREKRNAYRVLVWKPEGTRQLEGPRCWWENNIKINLKEIEWEDLDWIYVALDRDKWYAVVKTVMNLRTP
jgi:hypothetical protein